MKESKQEIKKNKKNYKAEKKDLKLKYKKEKRALKTEFINSLEVNNDTTMNLPNYTKGEEIFNMVSHIVGGALAIASFIITLILSISRHGAIIIFASIVYSLSMLTLYTMSSIYHGLSKRLQKAKYIFRKFDYISIFLLIAGSYTIFLLAILRPSEPQSAWILFGINWGIAIIGTIINAINVKKFVLVSNIAFLIMGWSIIWKVKIIKSLMHPMGFLFLVLGGIAYTLGVIFFALGKKIKYMHSIFHLFILAGSILHFVSIIGYVL